jgi:uncharacterized caspase-like protein
MAKRALLIGINKYQIPGANLRGCVNDVTLLSKALTDLYGFKKSDITVLNDEKATKKAMQTAIRQIVKDSKKGDVALIHYSGHGSNTPDDNGDESDNLDEILCPTDLDWDDTMRDDWLRQTFDGLKAGVNLTVIMDCCHSGTNTRALERPDPKKPIERYLPNPYVLAATESGRSVRAPRSMMRASTSRSRKAKDVLDVDLPEVLITGCRDTQTSADAFIDGTYNGALTYALVDAMRKSNGTLTYRTLHDMACKTLTERSFEQVPQLEGRKAGLDAPLFSAL